MSVCVFEARSRYLFSPPRNAEIQRRELPLTEATVLLNAISIHGRQGGWGGGEDGTHQLLKFVGDESCCGLPVIIFSGVEEGKWGGGEKKEKKKKKALTVTVHFFIFFCMKQREGFLKRDAPLVVSLSHG